MKSLEEAKAYMTQLAKEAGLDESATNAIVSGLGNDKFAKGIQDGLARHDEMSSAMDRARNRENEVTAKLNQYDEWYNKTALPAVNEASQLRETLSKYETTYGKLADGATTATPTGDWVRKADFDKAVNDRLMSGVQITKQLTWATADYMKRFGEVLDPDELEKVAVSRGLTPKLAYQEMIQPKVQAQEQKAREEAEAKHSAALKASYEQGMKDARSKTNWGNETARQDTDVYGRDKEALKKSPEDAQDGANAAFLDAWSQAEEATHSR